MDRSKGKDGVAAYWALGLNPDAANVIIGTAGGGRHLYFDYWDGVRNSTDKSGLDVRGEGGYHSQPKWSCALLTWVHCTEIAHFSHMGDAGDRSNGTKSSGSPQAWRPVLTDIRLP